MLLDSDFQRLRPQGLPLGSQATVASLLQQIRADVGLLLAHGLMDYSLLVGVHVREHMRALARERAQEGSCPFGAHVLLPLSAGGARQGAPEAAKAAASAASAAAAATAAAAAAPTAGDDEHGLEVFSLGIIDVLQVRAALRLNARAAMTAACAQRYNIGKRLERTVKAIRHARVNVDVSAVDPAHYADRFVKQLERHVIKP